MTAQQPRLRHYAVRCDSARHIERAGVGIARLGIRVFIPLHYREERQGKWMVSVQDGYLFPPYLFAGIERGQRHLLSLIPEVDGVDRILGGRNRVGDPVPIPVPYREMRAIRTLHHAAERMLAPDRFKEGQAVKIVNGPFSSFEGIFEKPESERVNVLISLFGRAVSLHLAETDIRTA